MNAGEHIVFASREETVARLGRLMERRKWQSIASLLTGVALPNLAVAPFFIGVSAHPWVQIVQVDVALGCLVLAFLARRRARRIEGSR